MKKSNKKINSEIKGFRVLDDIKSIEEPIINNYEFNSENQFMNYLGKHFASLKFDFTIKSAGKKVALPALEIFKHLREKVQLRYLQNDDNRIFYRLNYDLKYPIWQETNLKDLYTLVAYNDPDLNLTKTFNELDFMFNSTHDSILNIPKLNLPPKNISLYNNGVFNFKTMEFANDPNYFGEFDFVNISNYRLLPEQYIDPIKLQIVKRIITDWSKDDNNILIYLKQLIISAMDGDGRRTYNIIQGSGGNGKSSFLNILEILAGKHQVIKINLQDIGEDSKLEKLSPSTKLLVGHDLATNLKMGGRVLSRFKELITGEEFLVNIKYKPARLVKSDCLKIQSTNTPVEIFENSDAMKRRIRVLDWTAINFSKLNRKTNTLNFDLDELIGVFGNPDPMFYEAIIHFAIKDMDYFKEFIYIKDVDESTDKMISDADQVSNFIDYLKEQDIFSNCMPTSEVYVMYTDWLKQENPSSKPLSQRKFSERAKQIFAKIGYEYSKVPRRISTISKLDYNRELLYEYFHLLKTTPIRPKSICIVRKELIDMDQKYQQLIQNLEQTYINYIDKDLTHEEKLLLNKASLDKNPYALLILNLDEELE